MNRTEKAAAQAEMTAEMGTAAHAFLIDFKGLSVPAVTELRRQVRASKSEYVVVKNTLAMRALKDAPIGQLSEHFTGMTAIAYSKTDIVQLAKVLHTFGKTNPSVKVKAALVEGKGAQHDGRPVIVLANGAEIAMIQGNSATGKVVYSLCPPTGSSDPCAATTRTVEKNTKHRLTLDANASGLVTFSIDCSVVATYQSTVVLGTSQDFKLVLGATDGAPIEGSFDDVVLGFNRP